MPLYALAARRGKHNSGLDGIAKTWGLSETVAPSANQEIAAPLARCFAPVLGQESASERRKVCPRAVPRQPVMKTVSLGNIARALGSYGAGVLEHADIRQAERTGLLPPVTTAFGIGGNGLGVCARWMGHFILSRECFEPVPK